MWPTCGATNEKQLENPPPPRRCISFQLMANVPSHLPPPPPDPTPASTPPMWQKFKEQIPAVIVTALLVIGGAFWLHMQTVNEMALKQQQELQPLREQNDALKAASDENRRQIEATNKLLKEAISKREADVFRTDEEVQKLNAERMDALAEAIAKKVQPFNPLPKSPEEAEKQQNEQVDKVSTRL